MKKYIICSTALLLAFSPAYAVSTVFDSMDNAKEVNITPAVQQRTVTTTMNANSTYRSSIKEKKFNEALTNLDDAQVELRQDLSTTTSKYNEALNEKTRVCASCKSLKKEIREINKKMKNIDKSKKMINKNLQAES